MLPARSDTAPVDVSVVVPVYLCAPCLEPLWARTKRVLETAAACYELLFVDDASPDESGAVLQRLAARDARVRVVTMATNQGQPAAVAEGIAAARGEWIAVMDGDLQDPPEVLAAFLAAARSGQEIVVGRRRAHPQAAWRRGSSQIFSALARARIGSRLVGTHGTFSVISRRVADRYLQHHQRVISYLPVLEAVGLPILSVDYDRDDRVAGSSSYDVNRLVGRAWRVLKMGPIGRPPDSP